MTWRLVRNEARQRAIWNAGCTTSGVVKPFTFGRLAAATFAAEALFPIIHRAVGARYHGFTHIHDVVVDFGLAAVWLASALAGALGRPPRAFFVMLAGASLSFIHFIMFSISLSNHGPRGASLPWLVLFPIQMYLVVRSAPMFFEQPATSTHAQEPAPDREPRRAGIARTTEVGV
jgi:hypothetical protein